MTDVLVSTMLQVLVVTGVAGAAWAPRGRLRQSFRSYVGLTSAPAAVLAGALVFGVVSAVLLLQIDAVRLMSGGDRSVAAAARGSTVAATLAQGVILAVFKTAFSEELLFRGLIAKRLIAWLGFPLGNVVHAVLFAALHLLLFLVPVATPAAVLVVVAFSGVSAWVNVWMNERLARGSILPGWCAHAAANVTSYLSLSLP